MQIRRGSVVRVKSMIDIFLLADRIKGDKYHFVTRWDDNSTTTVVFHKHIEHLCGESFVVDSFAVAGLDARIVGVLIKGLIIPIQCVSLVEPAILTDEEKLMIVKYKLEQ